MANARRLTDTQPADNSCAVDSTVDHWHCVCELLLKDAADDQRGKRSGRGGECAVVLVLVVTCGLTAALEDNEARMMRTATRADMTTRDA